MTEINWNNFKAKFNGKETLLFENLAYHLFCNEYNVKKGIFRFKNQTGIETEPIQNETEYVGFQAKYYDTKISDNKDDIIDSIKKAKGKNPNLNKVLFYLNQEFSESTKKNKKDPQYKVDIETEATKINLSIEWRVPSHFEIQLALPENIYLSEYFFSLNKNIVDFLNGLNDHSDNILYSIKNDIKFNNQIIKVDRTKIIENLGKVSEESEIIIISGEGGCGKTAIIKELYKNTNGIIPFYIFKAAEFNVKNIGTIFNLYGEYSVIDFIQIHQQEKNKIIIIDSAEKLSDLENQDVFKEFISALLKNSWRIIFTTRQSYLDDLIFQFIEVYRIPFKQINIENLSNEELYALAIKYNFQLPSDIRLKSLVQNLFYLDEYLQNYQSFDNSINLDHFKDIIWNKKIQNSSFTKDNIHILREDCFISIAKARCDSGLFFIKPEKCFNLVLSKLELDEIIQYDSSHGGYFITHDIYEEWALNVIIERAYNVAENYNAFFEQIGTSLTIRRAFRKWLSEKLIDYIDDIKSFIENVFFDVTIEVFWKDEILISVLLSDYSSTFFNKFESIILQDELLILKKIAFLLRIACKEVDSTIYRLLGNNNDVDLKYIFTHPKGSGWNSTIDLIYRKLDLFDPSSISFIIPLLKDWNNNNKKGETTRQASLFALQFYKKIQFEVEFRYSSGIEKELIIIILHGASEIKDELKAIFNEVLKNNWTNHSDAYFELCKSILISNQDNISVLLVLPDFVLKLADLFWFKSVKSSTIYDYDGIGVENYYSLNSNWHHDYHPASTFQTPIYWLLQFSFKETITFILTFTNKSVHSFVESGLDKSVEEIEVIIDDKTRQKQYISHCLWNMYRGIGSPVTPYLLQSIHMALEKHLLDIAKSKDANVIENWLIYLIENSTSASITAVVTSVVLAYPDKFFNIALILFRTSKFFLYENIRVNSEYEVKSLSSIGYGLNYRNKIYEDERIRTCDDSHRKTSLENLAINYQFFRSEIISEDESVLRQKAIWNIIDDFYKQLPSKFNETDDDKTLRLLLTRIDRRKMKPKLKQKDDKIIIDFNPEIDPDLKKHSEEAQNKYTEQMKYVPLKLWAIYKFDKNKKYGDYEQYEKDPKLVLKETKEIMENLKHSIRSGSFYLFNSSIPAYTCSALIKEYEKELAIDEKQFCKEIIIEYATEPFRPNYQYQISDGIEVAVNSIPYLFNLFPEDRNDLKIILLFILFDPYPIGQYKRVCDYSIETIVNNLWDISPEDANDIFLGFLKLKPLFDNLKDTISREKEDYCNYKIPRNQLIEDFKKKYQPEIDDFISKKLKSSDIHISGCPIEVLETAFQLLPVNTQNDNHLDFITNILPVFCEKLFFDDEKNDYSLRHRLFSKFSYFILNRETKNINQFIQPFVVSFSSNREMASFFQEIISTEDRINKYEQFWLIWESFYQKIVDLCNNNANYYLSEIIHYYLLAWPYWKDTAKEWHSLKEREKLFYRKVVKDIGHCPSVLDSIAKLLNEIGSGFLNDGIFWISEIIEKNKKNSREKLETNTIYYIEILIRKYIYINRTKIKHDIMIKNKILVILNFLIERSSVNAYLLREDLL